MAALTRDPATARLPRSPASRSPARSPAPRPSAKVPALTESDGQSPSVGRSLAICLLYGSTSVSITFFNKAVFSVYKFSFPCFLTLMQISVCILALTVANAAGAVTLPAISRPIARLVYPLTLCWWAYVVSGIAALRYLNIPMFSTLRKSTALIVLVLEALLLRKHARPSIWISILVMVCGGLIAGVHDLSFNLLGYVLVAVCCISTALYLILIVHIGKRSKLDTFGLLYYNNVLSFPLMLSYLFLFTNEVSGVAAYEHIRDLRFWAFLLLSASQATVLNIAIFLCTKLNSPLATTVTGQMKDFVTIGFGLFIFGDVKLNTPNLVGLGISMAGSLMYSMIKLIASRAARRAPLNGPPSPAKSVKRSPS